MSSPSQNSKQERVQIFILSWLFPKDHPECMELYVPSSIVYRAALVFEFKHYLVFIPDLM